MNFNFIVLYKTHLSYDLLQILLLV